MYLYWRYLINKLNKRYIDKTQKLTKRIELWTEMVERTSLVTNRNGTTRMSDHSGVQYRP
jgi:hypothetical protein